MPLSPDSSQSRPASATPVQTQAAIDFFDIDIPAGPSAEQSHHESAVAPPANSTRSLVTDAQRAAVERAPTRSAITTIADHLLYGTDDVDPADHLDALRLYEGVVHGSNWPAGLVEPPSRSGRPAGTAPQGNAEGSSSRVIDRDRPHSSLPLTGARVIPLAGKS
jgi:hypothetical protein